VENKKKPVHTKSLRDPAISASAKCLAATSPYQKVIKAF
jgi:hypothetical protein